MVAYFDTASEYISPVISGSSRRCFTINYAKVDFNDSPVRTRSVKNHSFFKAASSVVVFEGLNVGYNGVAVGGPIVSPALTWNHGYINLPRWTTVAQIENRFYDLASLAVPAEELLAADPTFDFLLTFSVSGYNALDDLNCVLWGWVDSFESEASLQPVSLEGYKWPLSRR